MSAFLQIVGFLVSYTVQRKVMHVNMLSIKEKKAQK